MRYHELDDVLVAGSRMIRFGRSSPLTHRQSVSHRVVRRSSNFTPSSQFPGAVRAGPGGKINQAHT